MGYEVCFKFYEKAEKGYNTDEEKELKAKVGDPFEEITLEQLAGSIMAQFARRDIMVFDCEIIELSRKKINFKETDGGIIIKNKKYSFDKGAKVHCQDIVQDVTPPPPMSYQPPRPIPIAQPMRQIIPYDEEIQQQQQMQERIQQQQNLAPKRPRPSLAGRRPIRYEVYCPDKVLRVEAQKRGLAFTMHEKYPIYQELVGENVGVGYTYVTVDDNGHERRVHASHFQPETKGLIGPFAVDNDFGGMSMDGGNGNMPPMPQLR